MNLRGYFLSLYLVLYGQRLHTFLPLTPVQAEELCGENNQRNGYRERTLQTCAGEMHLKIPKFRHATFFPEDLLTRYSRVDKALLVAS